MTDIDKLRAEYEKADEKAGSLTGEYEDKRQKALDDLKGRYADQLDKATREAADAQARYLAYEAAAALLERGEEGESTLQNHTGRGGELLHEAYRDLKAQQD